MSRFKTELCNNLIELGICKYGDRCHYAHGAHELRQVSRRHPKYRTETCKNFELTGKCPFGPRCSYVHPKPDLDSMIEQLSKYMKHTKAPKPDSEDDDDVISTTTINSRTTSSSDLLMRTRLRSITNSLSTDCDSIFETDENKENELVCLTFNHQFQENHIGDTDRSNKILKSHNPQAYRNQPFIHNTLNHQFGGSLSSLSTNLKTSTTSVSSTSSVSSCLSTNNILNSHAKNQLTNHIASSKALSSSSISSSSLNPHSSSSSSSSLNNTSGRTPLSTNNSNIVFGINNTAASTLSSTSSSSYTTSSSPFNSSSINMLNSFQFNSAVQQQTLTNDQIKSTSSINDGNSCYSSNIPCYEATNFENTKRMRLISSNSIASNPFGINNPLSDYLNNSKFTAAARSPPQSNKQFFTRF